MRRTFKQTYISNLSNGLIETALEILQTKAFPVYSLNKDTCGPPYAHREYTSAGAAILLLMSGLDYHLARLKFLRDNWHPKSPLPTTPQFSWEIGDSLFTKFEKLLPSRNQKTFREQLIEITVMRDSIAHPKLYAVAEEFGSDLTLRKSTATLAPGVQHRGKTLLRKRITSERTKILQLPIVPTWIGYRDAVLAVMVSSRFLKWLEHNHGESYGAIGGMQALNKPPGFSLIGEIVQDVVCHFMRGPMLFLVHYLLLIRKL